MIAILYAIGLTLLCFAIGKKLLVLFKIDLTSWGQEIVWSISLGLGVLSYVVFFLGVLHLYYSWVMYLILLVIGILCRKEILDFTRKVYAYRHQIKIPKFSVMFLLLIILLIHIIMNSFEALAPPSEADTITYHFAVPKQYIKHHGIYYVPSIPFNQPSAIHMLYLMGMMLYSNILANFMNVLPGIILTLAIYLFGSEYFSPKIGLLAALVFYTTPMVTYITGNGVIELGLALFTFLGFYSLIKWTAEENTKWLIIAGIFLGFAAGSKLYGIISVATLIPIVFLWCFNWNQHHIKFSFKAVTIFLVTAICVASPWYLKNLAYTGNPFYPAFYHIFGGRDLSPAIAKLLDEKINFWASGVGKDLWNLFLVPWNITMRGVAFDAGRNGFGPMFLMFLPAVVLLALKERKRRWIFNSIIIYSSLFLAVWFYFILQRGRHLLPIAPGISIIIAAGIIYSISNLAKVARYITVFCIAIVFMFSLGVDVIYNSQFLAVASGIQPKDDFLIAKTMYYKDILWMNKNLPSSAKLLHLDNLINYYLDIDYLWAIPRMQGYFDWYNINSTDELLKRLRQEGITHIFINKLPYGAWGQGDYAHTLYNRLQQKISDKLLEEFSKKYCQEIYHDDRIVPSRRTLGRGTRTVHARVYKILYPGGV